MKKILFIAAIMLGVMQLNAQFTKATLQATGLTCAMCSNAVNKALKKVNFVESVEADIKKYTFEISFKSNSTVDFEMIKKKVEGAGFTVSGFVASIVFNNVQVTNNQPINIGDKIFYFVNAGGQSVNGVKEIKIIDKGFVSLKEFKSNPYPNSSPHTYHATL